MDGGLLTIEVGAEIEATVGRVDVGGSEVGLGGRGEGGLIGEAVEITGAVGAVGDVNGGIGLDEGLGLTPTGNCALGGLEGHGDHGNGATPVLDGLEEAAGSLGRMGRSRGRETEEIPEFDHLEIGAAEGLDGGDGPGHAALEREKDIFVGIGNLLRVVPVAVGSHTVDVILEGDQPSVKGSVKHELLGADCDGLSRTRG